MHAIIRPRHRLPMILKRDHTTMPLRNAKHTTTTSASIHVPSKQHLFVGVNNEGVHSFSSACSIQRALELLGCGFGAVDVTCLPPSSHIFLISYVCRRLHRTGRKKKKKKKNIFHVEPQRRRGKMYPYLVPVMSFVAVCTE